MPDHQDREGALDKYLQPRLSEPIRLSEKTEWWVIELGFNPFMLHVYPRHSWKIAHLCCFIGDEGGATNKP